MIENSNPNPAQVSIFKTGPVEIHIHRHQTNAQVLVYMSGHADAEPLNVISILYPKSEITNEQ